MDPIQSSYNFLVDHSSTSMVQQQDHSSPTTSFSNSVSTSHQASSYVSSSLQNSVSSSGNSSTAASGTNSAKFNFVDMTKDVEFKTRHKGDKSLKVNKQFRYNKRFQNNFFIFKAGQNEKQQVPPPSSSMYGTESYLSMDTNPIYPNQAFQAHPLSVPYPSDWNNNNASGVPRVNGRFVKQPRQVHSASATPTVMVNTFNESLLTNTGSHTGPNTLTSFLSQPPNNQTTTHSTLNALAPSNVMLSNAGQAQGSNPAGGPFLFLDEELLATQLHQQQQQALLNSALASVGTTQSSSTSTNNNNNTHGGSMVDPFLLSKEGISNLAVALSSQSQQNVPSVSVYPNGPIIVTNSNGQTQFYTLTTPTDSSTILSQQSSNANNSSSTTGAHTRLSHSQSFPQELFSSALATLQKQQLEQGYVSKTSHEFYVTTTSNDIPVGQDPHTTTNSGNILAQTTETHDMSTMEEDQWFSGVSNSKSGKRKRKLNRSSPNTLFGFGTSSSSSSENSGLNSQSSSIENSQNNSPNTLMVSTNTHQMNDEEEEHDDPQEEENEVEETMDPKHHSRKDKTLPHGQDEVAFNNQHHHHKDPRTSNVNLLDSRFVHMSTLNDDIFNPNENVTTTSGGEQHSTVDHSLIHATTGKPISIVHVQHHPKMSTSSSPHLAKNSQFPTNHGTLENNHVMSTDLTPPTSGPIEDELDSFLNSIHQSNQF